jgi:hypothetical protein
MSVYEEHRGFPFMWTDNPSGWKPDSNTKLRRLIIYVNKKVEEYILNSKKKSLNKLMFKKLIWIEIKTDKSLHINDFRVFSKKRKKDVTNEV